MIKMATWSVALISRIFVQASAIELAHIAERSRKSQEIKLAWIAECSRHYEKGNLLYEGQRPVALRVCVTRSGRVAFLRRRLKNAECINRGVKTGGVPLGLQTGQAVLNVFV